MSTKRNASAKPVAKVEPAKRAPSKKTAKTGQKDESVSLEPIVEAMRTRRRPGRIAPTARIAPSRVREQSVLNRIPLARANSVGLFPLDLQFP